MPYTKEQVNQIYRTKMQFLLNKIAKDKQDKLDKEREAQIKHEKDIGTLNLAAGAANMGVKWYDRIVLGKLEETYGVEGVDELPSTKALPTKYKRKPKEETTFLERIFDPLEEREQYKEFQVEEAKKELERARGTVPVAKEDDFYVPGQDVALDVEVPEAPIVPDADIVPDVTPVSEEIPDAKPGLVGKAFDTGQTILQLTNIGKTIADERATDEQKGVASVQGTKLLTDLATKRAGQETISQIGAKALTKKGYEQITKEGLKLTGKQTAGAVLGGALGGYTAVTEAKEAGVSWKEEDYDEAILHGMGSASGGLQTAGAGMMATGVGAPLGAVLYGIGAAGSVISGAGLLLEGLFGKKEEKEEAKPTFDAGRYFETIRRR